MTRRRYLPLAAALFLSGCSSCSKDVTATLEFWAFGREGEVVAQLMPEFTRRNPGIRVDVQQVPWTAAHEKLLTAFAGEATPDLAQIGNTWVPELSAIGAIEPLDARLARSALPREDYFAGIWDTNVMDGTLYGIPWYVDTRLLFYRRALLASVGFREFPRTWSAWLECMRRVKAEAGPDHYAIFLPTDEWAQPVILGLELGADLLRENGRYGAFDTPRFTEAFEFYIGLFHEGLAPVAGNTQIPNVYQPFAEGYYAMYITGPWNLGEFKRRLPAEFQDDWMTAPMPAPGANGSVPGVSLAGGSSLSIFKRSRHKAAAWKLVEYLSEPQQQVRFYQLTGSLPARKAAWESPVLARDPYARAFREQLDHVVATPKVPEWERIATRIWEHAAAAIRGRVSARQALAALDADVDTILSKRRFLLARREGP